MTKRTKKSKTQLPPIRCKGCDVLFIPDTRKQKYHNESCREDHYAKTYFAKTTTPKTCPNCGVDFKTTKGKLQDYCSPECRDEFNEKKAYGSLPDRENPATCQLCGQNHRLLGQHNKLALCRSCIIIAKAVDTGLATKYTELLTK